MITTIQTKVHTKIATKTIIALALVGAASAAAFVVYLRANNTSSVRSASVFTVDSTADEIDISTGDGVCASISGTCTLRAAVMEANASSGENVIELTSAATYTLSLVGAGEDASETGDLDITDDLIIHSQLPHAVIDANSIDRIFQVNDADLVLAKVKIINGYVEDSTGGAIYFDDVSGGGSLELSRVLLANNTSAVVTDFHNSYGGAIYGEFNGSTVAISSTRFLANSATSVGYSLGGDCGNACGGAIYFAAEAASTITIDRSTFTGNSVDATLTSGAAGVYGGALFGDVNDSSLAITDSTFSTNASTISTTGAGSGYGGAIALFTNNSTIDITSSSLMRNSITNTSSGANIAAGGGIQITAKGNGDAITVNNVIIGRNLVTTSDDGSAGGMGISTHGDFVDPIAFNMNNTTIFNNTVVGGGSAGGLKISMASRTAETFAITNSTFSGNTVTGASAYAGEGGGIYTSGTPLTITNSTISGNTSTTDGAGLYVSGDTEPVALYNTTITENAGGSGTSGIKTPLVSSNVTLTNSILAGNIPYTTSDASLAMSDCYGDLVSGGYNIIGVIDTGRYAYCSFASTTGDQIGDITTVLDPLLRPLDNNGGTTRTHGLYPTSPALEAGNPAGCTDADGVTLTTDQREYVRPVDFDSDGTAECDIGAHENE
jgi:CSLREA domain-containing protein